MFEPVASEFPTLNPLPPKRRSGRGRSFRWLLRLSGAVLLGLLALVLVQKAFQAPPRQIAPANPPLQEIASTPVSVDDAARAWEKSVVAIESRGSVDRQSIGTGFLVGNSGMVATSLHVSAGCTEGVVRLFDGTTYDVVGYAAVDPEHDLALLALKDPPATLVGLPLAGDGDPPRRQAVWAIGHPEGIEFAVSRGEVSRVLETSDLPPASQRFVANLAPGIGDAHWIQHSAQIAPGSSGGPLVDSAGRVLGMNAWVDREARFNYAVHARHLARLLEKPRQAEPLIAHATAEARLSHELWQLSATRLRSLLDAGRSMKWQPQKLEDYHTLQQLAWAITVARLPDALSARGSLGDRWEELAKGADGAERSLRQEQWKQLAQVTIVNEYAEGELKRPLAGLFFFATIERRVEGSDGRRGLIARLAGFEIPVFLPLEDQLIVPEAGAQCLVLGVNYHGRVVQWGDNPLELISAPVIVPGAIIKLGE